MIEVSLGMVGNKHLVLTEKILALHGLIAGTIGSGKSYMTMNIICQLIAQGAGVCLVDIDGQTAEDTLAMLLELGHGKKVVYFRPSTKSTFRLDPFHGVGNGPALFSVCNDLARAIGRPFQISGYETQMQRHRMMVNVLAFLGTNVNGKYLGLHRFMDVLQGIGTPAWRRMYEKVESHLDPVIARDWQTIYIMSRRDQDQAFNSTRNIFHAAFASSLTREIVKPGEHSLNFEQVIREKQSLIFNLDYEITSKEEMQICAAFVIQGMMRAAYRVRERYFMVIEEASLVAGQDLADWLLRGRKRKLSLILTTQGIQKRKSDDS